MMGAPHAVISDGDTTPHMVVKVLETGKGEASTLFSTIGTIDESAMPVGTYGASTSQTIVSELSPKGEAILNEDFPTLKSAMETRKALDLV